MYKKVKFEVGQVWSLKGISYKITRIGLLNGSMAAVHFQNGREWPFSYCREDGSGEISEIWSLEAAATPKSRECPCGIFRGDCTYHKD